MKIDEFEEVEKTSKKESTENVENSKKRGRRTKVDKAQKDKYEYYKKIGWKVVTIVVALLLVFASYKLAMFYIPFVIAYIVSRMLDPVVGFFNEKLKLNKKVSIVLSLLLLTATVGSVIGLIIFSLVNEITNIIRNFNINVTEIQNYITNIADKYNIELSEQNIKNTLVGSSDTIKNVVIKVGGTVLGILTSIPTMIMNVIITILAIIFMSFDKEYVKETVRKHVPRVFIDKLKYLIKETCGVAFSYIKAEAKLSVVCFVVVLSGLWIMKAIGVDVGYPTSLAIVTGLIDILPLLGAGIVLIPYAIYVFIMGKTTFAIGLVILWGIWAIIKQLIEPKFVSKQMGMHPLFTLISMYTGYKLIGVLGLMLGPITLLILSNIFKSTIDKGVLKSFFELD